MRCDLCGTNVKVVGDAPVADKDTLIKLIRPIFDKPRNVDGFNMILSAHHADKISSDIADAIISAMYGEQK